MPLDIITTNPYANPTKGKLFDDTAQPLQSAEILGLSNVATQNVNVSNGLVAGKDTLVFTDPQWGNAALQVGLGGVSKVAVAIPSNGSTISQLGIAFTVSGASTPAQATTSLQTRMRATQFDTGTSTTSVVGAYTSYGQWWRGTATGEGGFFFNAVFSQNTNVSGHSVFVGMCGTTSTLSGEPSALLDTVGVGYDSTDSASGNWYFMVNDGSGSATRTDLNTPRNTTSVLEFSAYCKGASGNITYQVTNRSTSSITATGTVTSDLPTSTTFLANKIEIGNNSTTSNGGLLLYKLYIQSPE